MRLLMADAEGEEMLRDLVTDGPSAGPDDDAAPTQRTKSQGPI